MIGLLSYGAFLPRYRLDRGAIFKAMGWFNPATYGAARGERTVANHDEDSITMAVAAGIDCLRGFSREEVDGLFLGSTTLPFAERQGATLVASALDLPENTRTADLGGCHRAGTGALLAALDAAAAGSVQRALVSAAECRVGKGGSTAEHLYGDGAAALLVGEGDAIAVPLGSHSVSADFVDTYRENGARFDRGWEDRWVRVEGFKKLLPTAIHGLLADLDLGIDAFAKVIYPCRYARDHGGIARKLGIAPEKLQDPLMGQVGDTGAAHSLLMLAHALATASPGDKLLVASVGSGCEALALEVTEHIDSLSARRGVNGSLTRRAELGSYEKYVTFRELREVDMGIRGEFQAPTALSVLWRDHRQVMGLVGTRCTACGTPQFPAQNICVNPECGATNEMEPYRFSDRGGTVFTFTGDNLAFSVSPPAIYGTVEMNGGGKLFVDFTDCDLTTLRVGQRIEMTLRRKYHDRERGLSGYFWKACPIAEDAVAGEEVSHG